MTITSFSPRNGSVLGVTEATTPSELHEIVDRAAAAATVVAATAPRVRQLWLNAVADAVDSASDELVALADGETALGQARLTGELARMTDQLRFYGRVAAEGSFLGVTVDSRTAANPRLVRVRTPLGPVAVFGSSNFPFGFGVLGNDVASAIAAGCPVVAKVHSAHLNTCLRLAEIAAAAFREAGAPDGIHTIIAGRQAGADLVAAPGIRAVGFTGSQGGGLALWRIANERHEVIPVYAEMGTVNPAVLTRGGVDRLDEVTAGFVGSFTLGAGQFCTKPGLLFAPTGYGVADAVARALQTAAPEPYMLTETIAGQVASGINEMVEAGASVVTAVAGPGSGWSADAAVLTAPISALTPNSRLLDECFGAVALVIEYSNDDELEAAIASLQGSLAAAVFGAGDDDPQATHLLSVLSANVGRVTYGDWPTGVAWTWAQHHGGPWPATSDSKATSVGAGALDRFVRPVTYQSVPDGLLPEVVRLAADAQNPWRIVQRIDGVLVTP